VRAKSSIERECLAEEEVKAATASLSLVDTTLAVVIRLVTADGPFKLVITVTGTAAPLLQIFKDLSL
jgi:hypothetical protein